MLSLLCGSPDVVDSPFYDAHSRRSSRGMSISKLGRSRSGSSKTKKKRILKGSIGAPTGFKHEAHIGADNMMTSTGAWDLDQWRAELEKQMQPQPRGVQSEPTSTAVSRVVSPASSVMAPRRKPVPSLLPLPREDQQGSLASSVSSSPIRVMPIERGESPGVAL
ncbi:hypothetical protein CTheo_808 [Ceratobasidium theobromae]|uniref:CRIB domain-containing protein n=1 Tax=Ceratobasidium theobromae TaxID=1582974 RepID=A0A5N5QVJ9_9AGAM|nr:hypothetical protein CTheo_808 [Ceratobasidium theobromae]